MKIIGVDEAGRGCLCGPVVITSVYLPDNFDVKGVRDSKKISSEKRREEIYNKIIEFPGVIYETQVVEHTIIDKINILNATLYGMKESSNKLAERLLKECRNNTFIKILIDGNKKPSDIKYSTEAIIKGDSKVLQISAASIIAKVTRDRIMKDYSKKYPDWDFESNKGYPNKMHMEKIKAGEWTDIHRKTFNPLKSLLTK